MTPLCRQTRKAAVLAQSYAPDNPEHQARLEQEAKDEEAAIRKVCKDFSLEIAEINPDGHCLFSAVADQLALLGIIPQSQATYAIGGEDTEGALDAGFMTREQFDGYCVTVRDTAVWGGEPEIVALSRAFTFVVQGGQPPIVVHDPSGETALKVKPAVWISYHRKLYGLGEHYNSLRPIQTR
ncbi:hypothetical protein BJ912DRAFT_1115903 [Pholiota molesta]|nr:hypothetical protein BJ912DRAFT_1115903 [Pholiota molesta]